MSHCLDPLCECNGDLGNACNTIKTSLDYAREILETGLRMLAEVNTDPRYYAEVAPHVNDAMANFLRAEIAEAGDASK